MRTFSSLSTLLLTISVSAMDRYVVRVDDVTSRLVHLEAMINTTSEGLLMSPFGADHLESGWATFVEALEARDGQGVPVAVEILSGGVVKVDLPPGETVRLKYSVRIGHDQQRWPFGAKEAAYVQGEMMMATGNALFITRLDLDSAHISFELPDEYRVATAWSTRAEKEFVAKGAEELVWTVMLLGKYEEVAFKTGDMTVITAYSHALSCHAELMTALTRDVLDNYRDYYAGPPKASAASSDVYLQVINVDSSYEGGGAVFTNSISVMLNKPPARCDTVTSNCWHHILIHELGHLWNATTLTTDEQDQWFREGFTDNLAWRLQRDMALIDEDQWQAMLRARAQEAEKAAQGAGVSLIEAGSDKGKYYDLIYSGGFTFAQRLDNDIVNATTGRKSLLDVVQLLYKRHAGTNIHVDRHALQKASEEVCECDLSTLFSELDVVR